MIYLGTRSTRHTSCYTRSAVTPSRKHRNSAADKRAKKTSHSYCFRHTKCTFRDRIDGGSAVLQIHWPATHIQGVHRNLRTNPVDPSITIIVSCILNSTDVCFCPPQCGLYSLRAQNKVKRLSPVDPGVTDLYPPRGYTHPVTRAIDSKHHTQLAKLSFHQSTFLVDLTAEVYIFRSSNIL